MKPGIAVIGSINIDIVVRCMDHPKSGETVFGKNHTYIPGGKGANQACAASMSGGSVSLIGCIGDDYPGGMLLESLGKAGVNSRSVIKIKDTPTGAAFITVDDRGGNTIIVSLGANSNLSPLYVEEAADTIRNADLLIAQCEIPLDAVEASIRLAGLKGIKTMVNLTPRQPIPETSVIWQSTVITVNESEAAYFTHIPVAEPEDAYKAGKKILEKGPEIVIITLGEKGSVAVTKDDYFVIPAVTTEVIDTTAAGDTYIGAFGVEWIKTGNIRKAMEFASCAAGISVSILGAQSSIPGEETVRELMTRMQAAQ